MKNTKSIISILLSIVLLFSSISVGSIVSFADATTLTRIENTFDDEGVEYTAYDENTLRMSKRTVNGVADRFDFAVWGASVEKYSIDSSAEQNGVRFTAAETITSAYPAVVKLYDNNTEDKAQFQPKANTSYSIKFKYNVTAAAGQDVFFQLRQRNTPWPAGKYTYNEADILLSSIATITKNTTTDGWVEVSATFTTSATPAYLFLNLSATAYTSGFEVWVDDIVIEELYNVTVNNYTPNQNKTIGMAQGSKASTIDVPTANGCMFDGIYADADYTVPLSANTVLDSYAGGTLYFKWVTLTPQQYLCNFENYTGFIVPPYDKTVSSLVSDTVYYGAKAMKMALQANGITAFEIRDKYAFDITKDVTYEVSFAYKTDADAEVSVGLAKATDICGSAVAYATTTVTGADSWQTAKLTITADKGTSESYALAMLVFAENGANIYFDDILVTDMSEFETVTMPTVSTDTYPTIGEVKEIWDGTVAAEFAGGTGTETDPYLISNGKELALAITQSGINESYYGSYYKITNDIYLNDIYAVNWFDGTVKSGYTVNSWYDYYRNADGTINSGEDFAGVIDGAGFTVYGLYYKHEYSTVGSNANLASGLIPGISTGFNATVSNLGIDYSYVHHRFTAGIIVGTSCNSDVTITNSYVGENVLVSGGTAAAFIGYVTNPYTLTLTNCYSLASYAKASNYGLAASVYNVTVNIKNCYNANGPLTSYSAANYATKYYFYNSYETLESGTSKATTKTNVYKITAENMQGEDVFTNEEKMPYLALDTNGAATTAYTATDGYPVLTSFVKEVNDESANESVVVWDGTVSEALEGEGTEASPYLIKSGADLAYVIKVVGGNDKYYKLTSDIYLNDYSNFNLDSGYTYNTVNSWYFSSDVPFFSGTLDGDGHTIYGLYYRNGNLPNTSTGNHGAGLVPRVEAGKTVTIKNLGLDKAYIGNRFAASAFVGYVNGASGSYSNINVVNSYVGSQVKLYGYDAGAFIGNGIYYNTTITNSYSLATVDGTSSHGLIGYYSATTTKISNTYNANGPVSTCSSGKAVSATVANCYATEQSGLSIFNNVTILTNENMKGSDVLTNEAKMPNLGSAFKPTANSVLEDCYIYLPAGTVFEEEYSVNCFDSFFVPLENDAVFNDAGTMTRGAYISFNELPDTTKIVIPSEVYDFVRYGTELELTKDSYYGDRMNVIRKTLDSQPEDAVNYLFITDIHYASSYFLTESLKNQINLMVKTANEDDSIDFVCIGGDTVNGAEGKERNLELLKEIYTPLLDCQKPVFIVQGNHDDGSYQQGSIDISEMFSFKEWRDNIINKYVNRTLSNGTEVQVVNNSNDDNPKYYYYDLENKNTRVVILDCIDYDMTYDENGVITGLEVVDETLGVNDHNRYKTGYTYAGYSKEQLKWLADEALGNLPEDYDVVFFSHMGIDELTSQSSNEQVNAEALRAIIAAYQNNTAYTDAELDINVDYSAVQGRIRSFQFGHTHSDHKRYDPDIDLTQINTGTANGYNKANRSLYSESEARFDVMSVTDDYVYQMCVGTKGTSMKIYYPVETKSGDLNFDSSVDICDLVCADLIDKGERAITTAADTNSDGVLDTDILLAVRNLLLGK